jgi:hypothetical protein
MSTQDDALDFQNSAIAEAIDSVDQPDSILDSEDPLGNNTLPHNHAAKRADRHERFTEAPRLKVNPVVYEDPDEEVHRVNGRRLTTPTRNRDRSLLSQSLSSRKRKG